MPVRWGRAMRSGWIGWVGVRPGPILQQPSRAGKCHLVRSKCGKYRWSRFWRANLPERPRNPRRRRRPACGGEMRGIGGSAQRPCGAMSVRPRC
ncbi:conserved hypothetical protein [Stenotrophomonas maltophilia D457]|nr:conserved hypothetical protein [Stenotrophomonas maltophilia D457]